MEESRLVANGLHCTKCNTTIFSYTTHDYKTCGCDNETSVDGGLSYILHGGKDLSLTLPIQVYSNDIFEKVRKYHCRGARGKSGKEPLRWIPLCEMTDQHLEAVIEYGGAAWHLELISKELQYRRKHPEASIPETEPVEEEAEPFTVIKINTKLRKGSLVTVDKNTHHMNKGEMYEVINSVGISFMIKNKHNATSLCLKRHCSHVAGTGAKYLLVKY